MSRDKFSRGLEVGSQWTLLEAGGLRRGLRADFEVQRTPPDSSPRWSLTSPPESASGVESATGLFRGGHSTGPPRSRSESAADFKVRLESAGVRSESAGVRQNSFESIRNIFWRRSAGLRSESGGSAGVRSVSARSPAAPPRSPLRDG